jgi:hypothetical protein
MINTTDSKYDNIENTVGMESGRFFKCDKIEDFERRA